MNKRLRTNRLALTDKILKREEKLLKTVTADYFNSFYNPEVEEEKEQSDDGVSDYITEEEESDIFDEDFLESENSIEEESKGKQKRGKEDRNEFIRVKKNKRDKYFKKGFKFRRAVA